MAKAVLLVRVSTASQELEAQRNDLVKYAKSKGYAVDDLFIIEDKESAIKLSEEERNGLNEMKSLINSDKSINAVFVWEISRLGRTEIVLHSIKEWLITNKVNLFIFDKQYQLLNEDGTENEDAALLFTMYAYFAKQEMKLKKARFARSRALKKSQNKWLGGTIPFGYEVNKDSYLVEHPTNAELVRYIFHKYTTTDLTCRQIGAEMVDRGIFNLTKNLAGKRIARMVKDYSYSGTPTTKIQRLEKGVIRESIISYPPLVSKETIDKAIEKLKAHPNNNRETCNIYYGKSIMIDAKSGHLYNGSSSLAGYELKAETNVDYYYLNGNIIDGILWYYASNFMYPQILVHSDTNLLNELKTQVVINKEKINNHYRKIDLCNKDIDNINKLFRKGRYTEEQSDIEYSKVKNLIEQLNNEITRLIQVNVELTNTIRNKESYQSVNMDDIVTITDDKRRKEIIDESIEKVVISNDGDTCTLELFSILTHSLYVVVRYNRKRDRKKIYQLNPITKQFELIPRNIVLDRWKRKYRYNKK